MQKLIEGIHQFQQTIFDTENTSWIIVNDYSDFDVGELYFVCVYWALQTQPLYPLAMG